MNPLIVPALLQLMPQLLSFVFSKAQEKEDKMPEATGEQKMASLQEDVLDKLARIADANPDDASILENVAAIVDNVRDAWPEFVGMYSQLIALGKKSGLIKRADKQTNEATLDTNESKPVE